MKKVIAVILTAALTLSIASCTNTATNGGTGSGLPTELSSTSQMISDVTTSETATEISSEASSEVSSETASEISSVMSDIMSSAISSSISSLASSEATGSESDGKPEEAPFEKPDQNADNLALGEMLSLKAVGNGTSLVDNSGMSGIEASNHLHGKTKTDMYVFSSKESLIFKHTEAEPLGQLYIWNYSENGKTNCGVKKLNIQYSVDGEKWTDFGEITLPEASQTELDKHGGCVAANFDKPVNLGGIPAQYIKLTPKSNYGGELTGLAEIRLFRHKIRPKENDILTAETLLSSDGITATPGTNATAASNSQGMSSLTGITAKHNNNPDDMWYTDDMSSKSMYLLNMDGTYPVKEIVIWNYNNPSDLDSGVYQFEIHYTVENPCKISFTKNNNINTDQTVDFSGGDWKKLWAGGKILFTLPKANGSNSLAPSLKITLDSPIQMQHIKIVPRTNYGGSGYGLSEIRLTAGKGWSVEPARKWTGILSSSGSFDYQGDAYNRAGGWIGADGIHAYHMNGAQQPGSLTESSKSFILFQDTAVGDMRNYKNFNAQTGYNAQHSGWVNMSYLVINGKEPDVRNIQFILQGKNSANHPYNNICDRHYWIGDMTVIGGKMYAIATRYMGWDKPEGPEGYDLIDIPFGGNLEPDMTKVPTQVVDSEITSDHSDDVPEFARGAVFENTLEAGAPNPDGYIYVFSTKDSRFRASRCLPDDYAGNYHKWQFWAGAEKGWIDDGEAAFSDNASRITSYSVGNESNVVYSPSGPFAGKYLNLFTDGSIFGQIKIGMSDSLTGTFKGANSSNSALSLFWSTEKYEYVMENGYNAVDQWNYNAKIQSSLSPEGELLFTYHIGIFNASKTSTAVEYAHPVFYSIFEIE